LVRVRPEVSVRTEKLSVNLPEAARLVGVSKPVIYRAVKEGAIKTFRPWAKGDRRVAVQELHRWAGITPGDAA
jgi:excisionase family DNA binding protein